MGSGPAVLVTGAAGYVGRLCVAALAKRRDELSALVALDWSKPSPGERIDGVAYEQGDICDPGLKDVFAKHGIDTVVHLASIVRAPKGAPEDVAYRVDVLGTQNVLEACEAVNAKRLIVTSSGAAYGYHPDNPDWLDEADPLRGNDEFEYSKHKRIVEKMLAKWREERPSSSSSSSGQGTVVGPDVHSPVTDLFEKPVVLGIIGSDSPFVFIWDQDLVACLGRRRCFRTRSASTTKPATARSPRREIAKMINKPYVPLPAGLVKGLLLV